MAISSARELELLCSDDWRAEEEVNYWGWRCLRRSGYTLRANCVMPTGWDGDGRTMTQEIERCAGWMRGRGVRPIFKLADGATCPPDLPDALARAGYAPEQETLVMTRPLEPLRAPEREVVISEKPSEAFIEIMRAAAASPGDFEERLAIVRTMVNATAFAVASIDGEPASIGLCRHSGHYAGFYLMRTAAHARRKGLARDVLRALCGWARWHAGQEGFLQVEEANKAAVALYASEGFRLCYRYRYWMKP